ncbi:response regulator [Glaciecola sp. SC05]|uniref:response regulator n=1 Tax=Glaciecola sp. SC05 TaxID=1987355 RepID=UPI003527AF7B
MNKRANSPQHGLFINNAFYNALFFAAIFIALSFLATFYSLKELKQYVLSDFGDSLEVVLETSENGIVQWVNRQQSMLEQIAAGPSISQLNQNIIEQQTASANGAPSELISRLVDELRLLQRIKNNQGILLFSKSGQVVVSTASAEITQNIDIVEYHQNVFQKALSAHSIVPPISFKLDNGTSQALLLITVPVRKNGDTIAVLAGLYDAEDQLSKAAFLGRIGESGETYLFDETGTMATNSRFNETLEDIGLIGRGQSAISNVKLYDPGINLMYNSSAERATDRLTLMARSAIARQHDTNTQGYRDYRGVLVIGAWRWSAELNMGITTEIDIQEALASYYSARSIVLWLLLLSVCIAIGLGAILLIMINTAKRKLEKAANSLEHEVEERTQQLNQTMVELANEQAVLQGLFDAIPDPIFCKDDEKRYIRGNHAFFKVFNKAASEVIGFTDAEITHKKDIQFFDKTDDEVLTSGKTIVIERVANQETGSTRLYQTKKSSLPLANGKGMGIIGISRDITEQRENEAALIQTSIDAQAANKAKSEFLARMSHEIRTPMNGVLGMLDLVMSTALTADQMNKLNVAKTSATSLLTIINDILDFSRVEAGKLEIEEIDFNPQELLEDTAKALAFKGEEKGIEVLVDVTKVEHSMLIGDPLRLRQILTNLLNNAIKFTESGHVVLKAKTIDKPNNRALLSCSIIDTGIGIPADKIDKLFESFSQVDSSTTRIYGGSGLGLAISKRLCELMGGTINVESVLHQGSRFSFDIELTKSMVRQKKLPDLDLSNWQVLIVDDNQINLDILTSQLLNMGMHCEAAISPELAMQIVAERKRQFDLVITDMNMPKTDGLTFTKDLRQLPNAQQCKILMLSSMTFNASSKELASMGLDGYLLKPVSTIDLFNTIKLVASTESSVQSPAAITEKSLYALPREASTVNQKWPAYHRVLVVEDNAVNRLVAQGLMQKYSLRHDIALDGQDAIEQLKQSDIEQPFTLILMDCQMPVLDGYAATQKIRSGDAGWRYKDIPIIAMTANALKGDREKCLAVGMNDHIAKPVDSGELKQVLHSGFNASPEHLSQHTMLQSDAKIEPVNVILPDTPLLTMDWTKHPPSLSTQVEMYVKGLQLYCSQHRGKIFELPQSPDDSATLQRDLHTLKGSSGNLGFIAMHGLCTELEAITQSEGLTSTHMNTLREMMQNTLLDAEALIAINKKAPQKSLDAKRSLTEICAEVKRFTINSELVPTSLVNELKMIADDNANSGHINELIVALEHYDYEKFTAILGQN